MAAPVVDPVLREKRRLELRDQMRAAAERLLAEGATHSEVSVERMAEEAGVGRSTFYKYFPDKGALLEAWYEQITEATSEAAAALLELSSPSGPEEVRERLGAVHAGYEPHLPIIALIADAAHYEDRVGDSVRRRADVGTGRLQGHIERGQEEGWIDRDLDAEETATWLRAMAERGRHQLLRPADEAEVERLLDAEANIVWNTLYRFST